MQAAETGIEELSQHVDSVIVILNEKLEEVLGDDVSMEEAFSAADSVLKNAVAGISEIINVPGLINVDFQDVRTVMAEQGMAMMGSAAASGVDRARIGAEQAVACPLLEGVNLSGARGVVVNITANKSSLKLRETKEVMNTIRGFAADDATIIFGAVYDDPMGEELRVTVIMVASSAAKPRMVFITSLVSRSFRLDLLAVMFTTTPRAPDRLTPSSKGQATACSAAMRARSTPEAAAEPIIAIPCSAITVRTSWKSTLIRPGTLMISEMPATAFFSTLSAAENASSIDTSSPSTSSSFSFRITITESTCRDSSSMPTSAACIRRTPSNEKGLVTTATVRMPISLATSATTGAAPVPVPPPIPAVMKAMCEPR